MPHKVAEECIELDGKIVRHLQKRIIKAHIFYRGTM